MGNDPKLSRYSMCLTADLAGVLILDDETAVLLDDNIRHLLLRSTWFLLKMIALMRGIWYQRRHVHCSYSDEHRHSNQIGASIGFGALQS